MWGLIPAYSRSQEEQNKQTNKQSFTWYHTEYSKDSLWGEGKASIEKYIILKLSSASLSYIPMQLEKVTSDYTQN